LIQGFRRAAFSNEAGVGSAAIAHAAVKTKQPASEGIVALLEPFIDTVVVCTITALVIIIANGDGSIMVYGQKAGGVTETSAAFATVLPWFPYILTVAVVLFAFSTMISWSYYGLQSWMYLFGRSKKAEYSYKVLFCIMVVIGSSASLSAVTDFSDAMIFAMSVPNLIGLIIMRKKVKEELSKYFEYVKNFGK
jgi:AGCS family alanine or glycine:cation symporter